MLEPMLVEQEARAMETGMQTVIALGNMPMEDNDSTERMIDLIEHARRKGVTIALTTDVESMPYLDQIGRTETYTADALYSYGGTKKPALLETNLPATLKSDEVAALARKSVAQIRKLADKGLIPGAQKLDYSWSFNAQLCLEWLGIPEETAIRVLRDHWRYKSAA